MSLATASCDLWQNEQRRASSDPVRVFIVVLLQGQLLVGGDEFGIWCLSRNFVNDAVFSRLRGVHDKVALYVAFDAFQRLAGVLRHEGVGDFTDAQDFARVNVDISSLTGEP